MARLALILNRDELSALNTAAVVEMWKHVGYGAGRRRYEAEFNEGERARASDYHKLFYRWHIHDGIPQEYVTTPAELKFIQRLINFFGIL